MNAIEFSNALGKVNDKYIMEAVTYERRKKKGWLKWAALAACLALATSCLAIPLLNRTPDSSASRPIAAYIQEDVSRVTAIYTAEGSTVIRLIEGEELNQLRTWTNDLRYILIAKSGKEPPYNAEIKEMYEFIMTEGDYPGYIYIITESGDSYLLIEGYWYFDPNPSKPPITFPENKKLTLDIVKELAKKGTALSWDDFKEYDYKDIGSGLHIYCYSINENYCLLIGGTGTETPPMYIRLAFKNADSPFVDSGVYIDIRTEDVEEFISNSSK